MEDDRAENQQDKAELEEEEMRRVPAEPPSNIKDAEREKGVIGWTLRNSSGVSKGIDKPVVQSGRDFPYIRVGGGQ